MFERTDQKAYGNSRNPALVELVGSSAGQRILDLGCGTGSNLVSLRRDRNSVFGLTLSLSEACAARTAGLTVIVADLAKKLPFAAPGSFDLVIFCHVLEHLVDPVAALGSVRRLLSDDGVIAIAVPSVTHYAVRVRHLLGDWTYGDAGVLDWTHLRFFSRAGILSVIRQAGYRVVSERPDGECPWWLLRRVLPTSFRARLDRLATRWWPEFFANQFLFLVQPVA